MEKDTLTKLEVALYGAETPHRHRLKAAELLAAGDDAGAERWEQEAKTAERHLYELEQERQRTNAINPQEAALYGGIAGITMADATVEIAPGASLSPAYTHVMSPYILAFKKPEGHAPHPGPWKTAKSGGLGFDVEVQFALEQGSCPTNFDRLNTLWWLLALLRLHHAVGIHIPVISDTPFNEAASASPEPTFWPLEMASSRLRFDAPKGAQTISADTLNWLKVNFVRSSKLMKNSRFNLAFRALDSSHGVAMPSSSMLLIWSALEALFRPGQSNITLKLCASIATYLEPALSPRDKLFAEAKRLYEVRGKVTHAAEHPEFDDVAASFSLARKCFIRALERIEIPDSAALLEQWKMRC
jgi:hypothetical protein